MNSHFEELLNWQAEVADAVIQLQEQILRYESLESNLLQRRDQALIHQHLGLKNDLKEVEYGLHYVQLQMQDKNKQLSNLQMDLEQKIDVIIKHYRNQQSQALERS